MDGTRVNRLKRSDRYLLNVVISSEVEGSQRCNGAGDISTSLGMTGAFAVIHAHFVLFDVHAVTQHE